VTNEINEIPFLGVIQGIVPFARAGQQRRAVARMSSGSFRKCSGSYVTYFLRILEWKKIKDRES
jgi:hypothetical protein